MQAQFPRYTSPTHSHPHIEFIQKYLHTATNFANDALPDDDLMLLKLGSTVSGDASNYFTLVRRSSEQP